MAAEPRAPAAEKEPLSFSPTTSFTGNRPGGAANGRLRQVAVRVQLPLGLRPDDRVDMRLDDPARIGVERNLRFVAGDDLVQLVLVEQREDLVIVVDKGHQLVERHAGHEEAGAKHHVHHRAVARRMQGGLREIELGVLELGARRLDLRLRDLHLRFAPWRSAP